MLYFSPAPSSPVFFYLKQAYRRQEGCMAQFSDGPVEWPWRIQLVHGRQKWERVSNSNCRKARKSQGMTLDRQPSINTATTLIPLLPQADDAPSLLALFFSVAHRDPKSPERAKPGEPESPASASTSAQLWH
ncbi:hypothetical protein Q8A73_012004 [Channa argus]|nr:hypothetical protein Q8A73_012004 [Channa argus]